MARACGRRRFEASSGRNFSIPTRPRAQLRVSLGGISWVEGAHQHKPRADTEDHSILLKTDTARARGQPTNESAADTTPRHPIRKQDTRARARSGHRARSLAWAGGTKVEASAGAEVPIEQAPSDGPAPLAFARTRVTLRAPDIQGQRPSGTRPATHTRALSPPLLHQRSIQHTHADGHSTTI